MRNGERFPEERHRLVVGRIIGVGPNPRCAPLRRLRPVPLIAPAGCLILLVPHFHAPGVGMARRKRWPCVHDSRGRGVLYHAAVPQDLRMRLIPRAALHHLNSIGCLAHAVQHRRRCVEPPRKLRMSIRHGERFISVSAAQAIRLRQVRCGRRRRYASASHANPGHGQKAHQAAPATQTPQRARKIILQEGHHTRDYRSKAG